MKKLSSKMQGLLNLMSKRKITCFPSLSDYELKEHGLTVYDTTIITWAVKLGYIEYTREYNHFAKLTELGKTLAL